jgi:hypothetical protein
MSVLQKRLAFPGDKTLIAVGQTWLRLAEEVERQSG